MVVNNSTIRHSKSNKMMETVVKVEKLLINVNCLWREEEEQAAGIARPLVSYGLIKNSIVSNIGVRSTSGLIL